MLRIYSRFIKINRKISDLCIERSKSYVFRVDANQAYNLPEAFEMIIESNLGVDVPLKL